MATSDLQDFSAQVMKVLNSIPHDQWPNQRMLGEFLFHKLRTVRRLERVMRSNVQQMIPHSVTGFLVV